MKLIEYYGIRPKLQFIKFIKRSSDREGLGKKIKYEE
jgi:hypothetical protein